MVTTYILKNNYISTDQINRLIKTITNNVADDRKEVQNLLETAKTRLQNLESDPDNFLQYIEVFKAIVSLLKEKQNVNSTLLKVMSIINSFLKPSAKGKRKDSEAQDLFTQLSELTGPFDEENQT